MRVLVTAGSMLLLCLGIGFSSVAAGQVKDTSTEEKTCTEIGFTAKTQAHANCVLRLVKRQSGQSAATLPAQETASAPNQTVTPAYQACQRYGFKQGSSEFSQCQLQLEQAAQNAQQQERQYQLQLQQYQQQLAAYEAQRREIEARERRQDTAAFLRGMANAQNCGGFLGCLMSGAATELGAQLPPPPVAPQRPPAVQNYTLRTANGQNVYCSYNSAINYIDCR